MVEKLQVIILCCQWFYRRSKTNVSETHEFRSNSVDLFAARNRLCSHWTSKNRGLVGGDLYFIDRCNYKLNAISSIYYGDFYAVKFCVEDVKVSAPLNFILFILRFQNCGYGSEF